MKLNWHIAVDLGSSNGRVFLGQFAGQKPKLVEAHRFAHKPIFQDGHWRWDWPYLRSEIRAGLGKAAELAGKGKIVSVGCSSWAQDFALLDAAGRILENPICYRDEFTRGLPQAFADIISPAELVKRVGGCISPITTLCKLKAIRNQYPELLKKTKLILHMADMVHFDLCGEAVTDWTLATAGQMFDLKNQSWDFSLLAQLDLPTQILPPVVTSPRVIGRVRPEASPHPALNDIPVISTAHHDTSCATVCLRPLKPGLFFIGLGSYVMPGCVLSSAQWPAGADLENNSMIGIADRQWGLFGACAGSWIIQECKRAWEKKDMPIEYDRLATLAEASEYRGIIDLSHPRFLKPDNMIAELLGACRESNLAIPGETGDIARLVFDSMAAGAAQAVRKLERAVNMKCRSLFLVGGGSKNRYLTRQISGTLNCEIVIGPAEATAVGNLMLQHEIWN